MLTFLELFSQLRPLANESCGHSVGAARAKDDSGMKNRAKANELTFIRQLQPGFWVGRQTQRRKAHNTSGLAGEVPVGVCLRLRCS